MTRANSFAGAIRTDGGPRDDTPGSIVLPADQQALASGGIVSVAEMAKPMNEHQQSLLTFSESLEDEIQEPAAVKKMRHLAAASGVVLARLEGGAGFGCRRCWPSGGRGRIEASGVASAP